MNSRLTFSVVDDALHAIRRGKLTPTNVRHEFIVDELGPLIELHTLTVEGVMPDWFLGQRVRCGSVAQLLQALAQKEACDLRAQAGVFPAATSDTVLFNGFLLAASKAAEGVGFPKRVADQLAAALGELRGNIEEHSERVSSGAVCYLAIDGRFEVVAVDGGIGVLASLRSCDEYADLRNDGDALHVAVRDGGSRHGSNSNRGHGYRPIFVGLANHSAHLRFRSGAAALEIDGRNPVEMPNLRITPKPNIPGLVVSVSCRP